MKDTTTNEEFASIVNEEQDAAKSSKSKKRLGIIVGCIAGLVALALVLTLLITSGALGVPSIFRDNDIFKKDCYTVSDKKATSNADVVVAKLGDAELTNAELQVFYQMAFMEFMNTYGTYAAYLGLDYTKPLDTLPCAIAEGYTWEQYFLESALDEWMYAQALALAADKAGFELSKTDYLQIADQLDTLEATSKTQKFENLEAMFKKQMGANVSTEVYTAYLELYLKGNMFVVSTSNPTLEELTAFYEENREAMEAAGIKQDGSYTVDVRHILFDLAGLEMEDGSIDYGDPDHYDYVMSQLQAVLDDWLEAPTEEYFAQLAAEYTVDYNGPDGGLYAGVYEGQMVKNFNDWCFDPARQEGDYGIVESKYGLHLMYFSRRNGETWVEASRSFFMEYGAMIKVEEIEHENECVVFYDKIALANGSIIA